MCNFKFRTSSVSDLADHFGLLRDLPLPNIPASWNIRPTDTTWAVRYNPKVKGRQIDPMRWGLVPNWTKIADPKLMLTNARAETLDQKPMFRDLLPKNRCIVVGDGYYEYAKPTARRSWKQPYAFALKTREPIGFAGLWSIKKDDNGEWLRSCTIITTEPNYINGTIHERMPAILHPKDYGAWLGEEDEDFHLDLLKPFPTDLMVRWPVSRRLGQKGQDDARLLDPIEDD